ncbi:autoimmune regulator isoform 1 domain protein, partial [Chlamydia psittaci 10_743_SC13]
MHQPLLPEARVLQQLHCSRGCLFLGCPCRSCKATALCKPTRCL